MYALTPTFSSKQQEWHSPSTMEYPWFSQVDSFSPTTLHDLPSLLYPLVDSNNVHKSNLSHSIATNSNSNNGQEVEEGKEDRGTVLEKKLDHNAKERGRRKKLNALYSSLRALLPPSDQKGKLSIPMTVARVVKYIPEQRQEIQRLARRKEELLKKKSVTLEHLHHQDHHEEEMRNQAKMDFTSQQISVSWLTDIEIALQIATSKWTSISNMLLRLEENGLNILSISSSVSSTERIFYTMHLEMRGDCRLKLEELNGMLFSGYTNQNERSEFGVNLFS